MSFFNKFNFQIVEGETEGISYKGLRKRRKTVLIKLGTRSISKQALQLGMFLALLQVADGVLTYEGLMLHGIQLEGNTYLQQLMHAYGLFPAILFCKILAIILIIGLTCFAHRRRWIRPFIYMLCTVYITLAVVPWTYILASNSAGRITEQHSSKL